MQDIVAGQPPYQGSIQPIVGTLKGTIDTSAVVAFAQIAPPAAAVTLTILSASGPLNGNYQYAVGFLTGFFAVNTTTFIGQMVESGNTGGGVLSATVSPTGNVVQVSDIPQGPTGTVARVLYRTEANGSVLYYLTTIYGNSVSTFNDDIADASLGAAMPTVNTTGTVYDLWQLNVSSTATFGGGLTVPSGQTLTNNGTYAGSAPFTAEQTFSSGITGTGNIGTLGLGSGALGSAWTWTAAQTYSQLATFSAGITGTGNTGTLAPGVGLAEYSNSNLLFNSSANLGLTGWAQPSELSAVPFNGQNNSAYFSYTGTTAAFSNSAQIPAANGESFTISGWVFNGGASGPNGFVLVAFNSSGTAISNFASVTIPAGTGWTYVYATGVAPSGTTHVSAQLFAPNPSASSTNIAWTRIKVELGSYPTPYSMEGDYNYNQYGSLPVEGLTQANWTSAGLITASQGITGTGNTGNLVPGIGMSTGARSNLLFNPNAGFGLLGWSINSGGGWITEYFNGPFDDSYFAYTGDTTASLNSEVVPVSPGITYTLSGWVYNMYATGANGFGIINQAGTQLASVTIPEGQGWTFVSCTATIESGTTQIAAQLQVLAPYNSVSTIWQAWTRLKLEQGNSVSPYSQDGSLNQSQYGNLPLSGLTGQQLSGSVGVAAVVAQAQNVHVTSTAPTTIISFTPSVTGLYEVKGYVYVSNGTSGNDVEIKIAWTDVNLGGEQYLYPQGINGGPPLQFNGGVSIPDGPYALESVAVFALGGSAISVTYTDPTNTPSDYVSAVITRLT